MSGAISTGAPSISRKCGRSFEATTLPRRPQFAQLDPPRDREVVGLTRGDQAALEDGRDFDHNETLSHQTDTGQRTASSGCSIGSRSTERGSRPVDQRRKLVPRRQRLGPAGRRGLRWNPNGGEGGSPSSGRSGRKSKPEVLMRGRRRRTEGCRNCATPFFKVAQRCAASAKPAVFCAASTWGAPPPPSYRGGVGWSSPPSEAGHLRRGGAEVEQGRPRL